MKQILIHDCAVSLVPRSWHKKRKISEYIRRTGRIPLVNASDHQHLLSKIPAQDRLDRPDILHFTLLLILNLAKISKLEILFSIGKDLFRVDPETRLPRDQQRFYGILENILSGKNNPFIQRVDSNYSEILSENIWLFTRASKHRFQDIEEFPDDVTLVFGGRAHSSPRINNIPRYHSFSLGDYPLELWTATSLVLPKILRLI